MSLADELALVGTNPLVIRCAKCRWVFRATNATLEEGRVAHEEHRRTKHGYVPPTKRHRLHRTKFRSALNHTDIDTNIKRARGQGASKWTGETFDYACEKCGNTTPMSKPEFDQRYPKGRFVCDVCASSQKAASSPPKTRTGA